MRHRPVQQAHVHNHDNPGIVRFIVRGAASGAEAGREEKKEEGKRVKVTRRLMEHDARQQEQDDGAS